MSLTAFDRFAEELRSSGGRSNRLTPFAQIRAFLARGKRKLLGAAQQGY